MSTRPSHSPNSHLAIPDFSPAIPTSSPRRSRFLPRHSLNSHLATPDFSPVVPGLTPPFPTSSPHHSRESGNPQRCGRRRRLRPPALRVSTFTLFAIANPANPVISPSVPHKRTIGEGERTRRHRHERVSTDRLARHRPSRRPRPNRRIRSDTLSVFALPPEWTDFAADVFHRPHTPTDSPAVSEKSAQRTRQPARPASSETSGIGRVSAEVRGRTHGVTPAAKSARRRGRHRMAGCCRGRPWISPARRRMNSRVVGTTPRMRRAAVSPALNPAHRGGCAGLRFFVFKPPASGSSRGGDAPTPSIGRGSVPAPARHAGVAALSIFMRCRPTRIFGHSSPMSGRTRALAPIQSLEERRHASPNLAI